VLIQGNVGQIEHFKGNVHLSWESRLNWYWPSLFWNSLLSGKNGENMFICWKLFHYLNKNIAISRVWRTDQVFWSWGHSRELEKAPVQTNKKICIVKHIL
jgi:hypothetical protein